jgi:LacI family transcriptional regulator
MRNITIKDIAKQLGLSVSTVSRALNDHPDINEETKIRVSALAKELGYKPNIFAKSLKINQSKQIGVIVPQIRHDFFAIAISGIEEVAYQRGYTVIVAQSNEKLSREIIHLNSMFFNRVAGTIISVSQETKSGEHFKELLDEGMNMVFFDRVCHDLDVHRIIIDDYQSSYDAVKYLISLGLKKIVHFAGPQPLNITKDRRLGYENAMRDLGLEDEIVVLKGGMNVVDGYHHADKLIHDKAVPEAIFAVNDPVAIGAFKRLKEENIMTSVRCPNSACQRLARFRIAAFILIITTLPRTPWTRLRRRN